MDVQLEMKTELKEEQTELKEEQTELKEEQMELKEEQTELKEEQMELRKQKLIEYLRARGLEFRTDSALCSKYIDGTTEFDLDYIVQRMGEMKYLYEYCNMKRIKKQVYYKSVGSNKYKKNLDSNVSIEAERIALNKYSGGKYPEKFPWEDHSAVNKFYFGLGLYFLTIITVPIISYFYSTI
jgi:hypothetical protein